MKIFYINLLGYLVLALFTTLVHTNEMRCVYGDRGSLTAICYNATPNYFKLSPYKFDHLDETLKCIDCTLNTIDTGTFDIAGNQIKYLQLKHSQIDTIKPRAFMGLMFLLRMDLSKNAIRQIPPGTFSGVKKIQTIDLSSNLISVLSEDAFAELENLEILILQYNNIKMILPRAFNGLVKLRQLDLSFNEIPDISHEVFANVTTLFVLDLSHNKITNLHGEEFFNLTLLAKLDLASNEINVPIINLQPGNILNHLNLSKNIINELQSNSFQRLTGLEVLDLSHNRLKIISKSLLSEMFNLHRLLLNDNLLVEFKTGTFTGLPQLRELNCSHNHILSLEVTGAFSLHSLHTFDISDNDLVDFDYAYLISRLPRLTNLRMQHNQFPCNLDEEMRLYFNQDNFEFILDGGNTKCTDKPTTKETLTKLLNSFVEENYNSLTTGEIWIAVFLSFVFLSVVVLFVMVYMKFRGINIGKNGSLIGEVRRAVSRVQLIAADTESREDITV